MLWNTESLTKSPSVLVSFQSWSWRWSTTWAIKKTSEKWANAPKCLFSHVGFTGPGALLWENTLAPLSENPKAGTWDYRGSLLCVPVCVCVPFSSGAAVELQWRGCSPLLSHSKPTKNPLLFHQVGLGFHVETTRRCVCNFNYNKIIKQQLCVLLCLGPDLRNGFLGVRGHRPRVHCPNAPSWPLPGVLSLLRQLWGQDAAGAEVVHRLSQEGSLLEHVRCHSHYPVSVCIMCASVWGLEVIFCEDALFKQRRSPSSGHFQRFS